MSVIFADDVEEERLEILETQTSVLSGMNMIGHRQIVDAWAGEIMSLSVGSERHAQRPPSSLRDFGADDILPLIVSADNEVRGIDLVVRIGRPKLTHDRWALYRRYQHHRHREDGDDTPEALEGFLYTSCVNSTEWRYYLDGLLVMVAIADICPQSISAVYCYWDPRLAHRGLGVFNVLTHISTAAGEGIPYLYLGYLIRDCRKTAYKAGYAPFEFLDHRQAWSSPLPV